MSLLHADNNYAINGDMLKKQAYTNYDIKRHVCTQLFQTQ